MQLQSKNITARYKCLPYVACSENETQITNNCKHPSLYKKNQRTQTLIANSC